MKIIRFIRRLFIEQPSKFVLVIGALVIASLLEGIAVALLIPLLSFVEGGSQDIANGGLLISLTHRLFALLPFPATVSSILIMIFFVAFAQQAMILVQQKIFFGSLYRFEAILRERLYEAIFKAEWSFFLKKKAGELTTSLTTEVTRAGLAFYYLNHLLSISVVILVYLGLAALLSWKMTLATIFIGLGMVVGLRRLLSRATEFGTEITLANTDMQSEATEQISGAKMIKGSAVEDSTIDQFKIYLNSVAQSYFRNSLNTVWMKGLYELAAIGMLCTGIYIAIVILKITLATLIVFLFIFYRLLPRISNSQSFTQHVLANLPALAQIDELIDEAQNMREKTGDQRIADLTIGLTLEGLSFAYVPDHPVIKNLGIDVMAGKTTAIVGGSGAGKSTIIDLIMGLLRPDAGDIRIDKQDLKNVDLKSWRNLISYVAQDTVLFHESVKTNIAWGLPDVTENEIEAAAKLAHAHDFITELPEGYGTVVGDRGVRLSGGQKQRLALARALVRKPKLLILDEATSALDAESEKKIQLAIESLAKSMTMLIVTHRLATVRHADIIYVMENGELVEKGTWAELEKAGGRLAELKKLQALD